MLQTFLLVAILAWSGIAAAVVSMRNEPASVMAKTEASEFDARWDDATVLKKQDRLPLLARPMPEPNPVELVPDVPTRVPPVVMLLDEDKPAIRRGRHVARDICTRHGKRKIAIRGGRSWRCRQ